MFVEMISKTIYEIYFKKCTIYINSFSGIFLSNDKNNLSIKDSSNRALLNKFNVDDWDECTTDLVHIKFLIKFSSIFNKIADVNELNNIEFIKNDPKVQVYFIHYGHKKYFDMRDYDYNNASIPYDHKFKSDFILGGNS